MSDPIYNSSADSVELEQFVKVNWTPISTLRAKFSQWDEERFVEALNLLATSGCYQGMDGGSERNYELFIRRFKTTSVASSAGTAIDRALCKHTMGCKM